jgi:hypothetical protein
MDKRLSQQTKGTCMNIERIYDKYHSDLYKFRMSAIHECGGASKHIMMQSSHKNIIKVLKEHGVHRIEDIYRFTESKWQTTEFNFIDAHYADDGNITNISGAKHYNNWLRGGIYHFGLKAYSKQYPSILFQPNGHLQRLINYSIQQELSGIFISIYPHTRRLQALCRALKTGSGIPTTGDINLIRRLKYAGTHMFNDVEQDFFVVETNNITFDYKNIIH